MGYGIIPGVLFCFDIPSHNYRSLIYDRSTSCKKMLVKIFSNLHIHILRPYQALTIDCQCQRVHKDCVHQERKTVEQLHLFSGAALFATREKRNVFDQTETLDILAFLHLPPADSLNAGNQLKFARPANLGSKSMVDSKVCRTNPFSKSAKKGNAFRCQESSRFWLWIWQNCGRSILRLLFWRLGLHDYCCHLVVGGNTVFSFQETSTCEIKECAGFCAFNHIFSHTSLILRCWQF